MFQRFRDWLSEKWKSAGLLRWFLLAIPALPLAWYLYPEKTPLASDGSTDHDTLMAKCGIAAAGLAAIGALGWRLTNSSISDDSSTRSAQKRKRSRSAVKQVESLRWRKILFIALLVISLALFCWHSGSSGPAEAPKDDARDLEEGIYYDDVQPQEFVQVEGLTVPCQPPARRFSHTARYLEKIRQRG